MDISNIGELIAETLDLQEPWQIERVKFNAESHQVDIFVTIKESAEFACPKCGKTAKRHGYEKTERAWRHADILFCPTYVHCKRPKIKCENCGVKQVNAPWERKNSRYTYLFEGYTVFLAQNMAIRKVEQAIKIDEKAVVNIMKYWVNKAVDKMDLSALSKIAVDETSFKKGHKYVTLIIDLLERKVIDIEDGRTADTIDKFKVFLESHGGNAERITTAVSDMSKSYLAGIANNFPNAMHVIDKFHVKQLLTKAMDEVRREEQRESAEKLEIFRGRRLLMIPQDRQTEQQKAKTANISKVYPKTGRAFQIVSTFDEFYRIHDYQQAEGALNKLISWMRRCRLQPMKDAAQTLKNKADLILNYFIERVTNAICEGLNSMVQAAKRRARGYNTFEGYKTMIYMAVGKLQLECPNLW